MPKPARYPVISLFIGLLLLLSDTGSNAQDAKTAGDTSEPEWWVSRFDANYRSWLPLEQYPPEPQPSPHMVIYEITQYPYKQPTPEQVTAAEELVRESLEAARRNGWFEFEKALNDGYELMVNDRSHYVRRDLLTDGRVLDPDRPEYLMFYDTPSGKKLVGYMYLMSELEEHGPQLGGPQTIWHYHLYATQRCLLDGLLVAETVDDQGLCVEGIPSQRSAEMLHVWFVDHPDGAFATTMRLPGYLMRALEERAD